MDPRFNAPITYIPDFVPEHDVLFQRLWDELEWLDVAGPRLEYYTNDVGVPYGYGKPPHSRTYFPQPLHPAIRLIRSYFGFHSRPIFEVCFLNGYRDGKDQLGWHSDDSPEMDDTRPIAIISLGAEREIWFREKGGSIPTDKLLLTSGSLCLMHAGMQDTHEHRIPRSSLNVCGPRISLTFRGYTPIASSLR